METEIAIQELVVHLEGAERAEQRRVRVHVAVEQAMDEIAEPGGEHVERDGPEDQAGCVPEGYAVLNYASRSLLRLQAARSRRSATMASFHRTTVA
ncbi:hypothetical protein [Sorangium sp. So ce124]|uniref:hypothetical protein n=1 Tax=Sorangium sp. So ce124 TaxID=3133280 RepID=UPI003F637ED4